MNALVPEHLRDSPAMAYVVSKGWDWKEAGSDQIQVRICPFCQRAEYKFYMSCMSPSIGTRDGLFLCFKCQATGNLRKLQESLGDRIANVESRKEWAEGPKVPEMPNMEECCTALLSDAEVMDHLMNVRGLTKEVIVQQKLGLKENVYFTEAGVTKALVIPYVVGGNVTFVKYRSIPPAPKDFMSPGGEAQLYNYEYLQKGIAEVCFLEGEMDLLSCLSNGITEVVAVPGAMMRKTNWIEAVDRVAPEKIYIALDSDKDGQRGAQELASRIGIEKCYKISWPKGIKDANEFFLSGKTKEDFQQLKQQARLFDIDGVSSSGDALTQLENELEGKTDLAPTYISPWPSLNRLVGYENGDVIALLGDSKQGKTTLGLNLLDHMASAYGEAGLLCCLEMPNARLARKWVSLVTGFEDKVTTPGTAESKEQLTKLKEACVTARDIQKHRDTDIYFSYPLGWQENPDSLFTMLKNAIRRYGCKWICFDNLQKFCDESLGKSHANRTVHLSQLSKKFASLAKDYGIKLILILQPRQIEATELIQARHIDGSSQVSKDVDCLISIFRSQTGTIKRSAWESGAKPEQSEASFDPKMRVTVALSRYSSGGSCSLYFDGARSQVREFDAQQRSAMAAVKAEYNNAIPMEHAEVMPSMPLGETTTI